MTMKKIVCSLALVFMVILSSCLLSACTDSPEQVEAYSFDDDVIPSVTSVVGERSVIGVETEGDNEYPSIQYTYGSDAVSNDLAQYIEHLQSEGWIASGPSYNLDEPPGTAQFVKESADDGQIMTMVITFEEGQYSVKITKLEGAIASASTSSSSSESESAE